MLAPLAEEDGPSPSPEEPVSGEAGGAATDYTG